MEACYRNVWRGTQTWQPTCCWWTPSSNVLLRHQILQMFEENYPEGLKRLFVIKGESDTNPYWVKISVFYTVFPLLQPLRSFPWRTTWSNISWARTRDRRSLSSGVRRLEPFCTSKMRPNDLSLTVVRLADSQLAGGFTEAHRCRGAACDLRGETDGSRWRSSLSNPGESAYRRHKPALDRCFQSKDGLMSWVPFNFP